MAEFSMSYISIAAVVCYIAKMGKMEVSRDEKTFRRGVLGVMK